MNTDWTTHPVLEFLFGGNLIEGPIKATIWIVAFCALCAFTVGCSPAH